MVLGAGLEVSADPFPICLVVAGEPSATQQRPRSEDLCRAGEREAAVCEGAKPVLQRDGQRPPDLGAEAQPPTVSALYAYGWRTFSLPGGSSVRTTRVACGPPTTKTCETRTQASSCPWLAHFRASPNTWQKLSGYVMQEYDGKRPISELLDEAAAQVISEDIEKTEDTSH